jgi:hypothetical protein
VDQLLEGPLFERLKRGKRKEMKEGRKQGREEGFKCFSVFVTPTL